MGNQASRVLERSKERKGGRGRRRSNAALSARSHQSSVSISHVSSSYSHGNYDWLEHPHQQQQQHSSTVSGGAIIDHALAAASSPMRSTGGSYSSSSDQQSDKLQPVDPPRRKSVTEAFMRRKGSFTGSVFSQNDFREYDRLQRQV